jgi:cell division protein FtsQ
MNEQKEEIKNRVIMPVNDVWLRSKAVLFVLFVTFFSAFIIVVLKNDLVNKKIDEVENLILDYVGKENFMLDDIVLSGRNRTSADKILETINMKRGDNLLKADVVKIKRDLEDLPWVRDVEIKRSFFPNVLNVKIEEKEVLAIWQLNEKFYPLDVDGYVIEADYVPKEKVLLVVGPKAAEKFIEFLKNIRKVDEEYIKRIKVASYISNRRWNVILDDIKEGITIKLPEKKYEDAWKKLVKLEKTKGILKRKLTIIDLRLDDKVIVKLQKEDKSKKKREHQI